MWFYLEILRRNLTDGIVACIDHVNYTFAIHRQDLRLAELGLPGRAIHIAGLAATCHESHCAIRFIFVVAVVGKTLKYRVPSAPATIASGVSN